MRLLSPTEALHAHLQDKEVFNLYDDGTEGLIEDPLDITRDGRYGVEL